MKRSSTHLTKEQLKGEMGYLTKRLLIDLDWVDRPLLKLFDAVDLAIHHFSIIVLTV
jgi:hypothetical protein